jgi:hypothetical protein
VTIDVCPKEVKIGYPGRIKGMRKEEKLTKGEREENWLLGMVEIERTKEEEEEDLLFDRMCVCV